MAWQPNTESTVDMAQAETAGRQAGEYLICAVHAAVDGARIGPVQVLMDPQSSGKAVYAVAIVEGPLRGYLATAWGRAGHVANKQIVSHPNPVEAGQALSAIVRQHLAGQGSDRTYVQIGVFHPEAAG
jgi:hypothetical protein